VPERTRTSDLQVRNLTLYPLSYGHPDDRTHAAWDSVAEREGFEPSEEETPFNGLANRRTRPLCDLSAIAADDSMEPLPGRSPRPGFDVPENTSGARHMPPTRLPIIGYPLHESPQEGVLRAAFDASGSGIEIERWERRPHQLADALNEVRAGDDFVGALVASPHKEKAPPLSDALSDDARISGAVNVYVRADGRLRGHNTDADGVRAGLEAILPKVRGKWPRNAVVLGAGGGARAVVAVLIGSGFQHVVVFNRHLHRAEALVAHFSRSSRHMELRARPWHDAILEAELSRAELLVNASGVGQNGGSPIPTEVVPPDRHVLDLVLAQGSTSLMDAATEQGGTAANGQTAFLASAGWTVRLLTGSAPSSETLRTALAAELGVPEEGLAVVGD
jgi:shikimate dehydrogenase